MDQIKGWIDQHAKIGIRELPKSERSGRYAMNLLSLMAALSSPVWMLGYALIDPWGMAPLWLATSPISLFVFMPYLAKFSSTVAHVITGTLIVLCFGYATYLTGRDSGLYLFILMGMVAIIIHHSATRPRETIVFTALFGIAIVSCYLERVATYPIQDTQVT